MASKYHNLPPYFILELLYHRFKEKKKNFQNFQNFMLYLERGVI